ncbi:MAG: hypothetical protein ACMUIM_03285 [bacterium]
MKYSGKFIIIIMIFFVILIFTCRIGNTQWLGGTAFNPWPALYNTGMPFYQLGIPFGMPYSLQPGLFYPAYGIPVLPSPLGLTAYQAVRPLQRSPRATIIFTSPTLTAVNTTPGVFVIGSTAAVASPTVIVPSAPAVPATTAAAPAPLFSILAILYAQALYAPAALSTANPLLFAYLSTLVL